MMTMNERTVTENNKENQLNLPLIPLRGLLVFPQMTVSLDIERQFSMKAADYAAKGDHLLFLSMQRQLELDSPGEKDIYTTGTVCRIRQFLRQPDRNYCRLIVEGLFCAEATSISRQTDFYHASVIERREKIERLSEARKEAHLRTCLSAFHDYLEVASDFPAFQFLSMFSNPDPQYVIWYITQNLQVSPDDKQTVLECGHLYKRMSLLTRILKNETQILEIEKELDTQTQEQVLQNQREYYLREELRAIQAELGEDGTSDELEEYSDKINALCCSDEVREKLQKELARLKKQPFGSSEAAVMRSYLDICLELPWGICSEECYDIQKARDILDQDHYGLEKVKERVIEYLAVKQLSPEMKGGIICLSGPPGTGKTSIAMSVARATGRKLVRVSLGGIHDEAEIRGHRKTYIGSMPGRIINGILQAKTSNPIMVLDEIDKLGSDYRGDPSAALLEALDPEQNDKFRDHFLELPFDLSHVFFITTANTTSTIPRALLDRMEVIELSSYTDEEKLHIAKEHLLPKQRKKHGLKASQIRISDDMIRDIIRSYTRESGVRILERELANLCRKAACGIADGEYKALTVRNSNLEKLLGVKKYKPDSLKRNDTVGLVRGLAYTSVGGEILDVEVSVLRGSGKLELTGNLGDVMKESAKAAVSYIRSRCELLKIDPDFYKDQDLHVHFPEAAVPKDGPSAGITICIGLISALTNRPVRSDIAMTGEITLRGRILAIGGLREKTMAALRAGIRTVIIPKENESDLNEIDQEVRHQLTFITADHVDQILDIVLMNPLTDQ